MEKLRQSLASKAQEAEAWRQKIKEELESERQEAQEKEVQAAQVKRAADSAAKQAEDAEEAEIQADLDALAAKEAQEAADKQLAQQFALQEAADKQLAQQFAAKDGPQEFPTKIADSAKSQEHQGHGPDFVPPASGKAAATTREQWTKAIGAAQKPTGSDDGEQPDGADGSYVKIASRGGFHSVAASSAQARRPRGAPWRPGSGPRRTARQRPPPPGPPRPAPRSACPAPPVRP